MDAPDGSRLHMPRPIRAGELDASRLLSGGASAGAPGGSDPSAVFGAARRRKLSQVSRTSRRTIAEDRERAPPPYSNDERLMLNDRRYHTSTMMTDSPSKRSTASRHTQLGALTASNLHMHETAKASSKRSHLGVETRKRAQSPGAASVSSSIISAATLPQTPSFAAAALALQKERSRGAGKTEHTSMIKRFLRHAERTGRSRRSTTLAVVSVVVLLKWTVGLGGYSGYGTAPLFGDLEAQRHWMGLTLHREVGEWYFYDLEYWGLDYPPLTAYHSLVLAYIGRLLDPSYVSLRPPSLTSPTGWADLHADLKNFLRATVIGSELLSWIPAVLLYCSLVLGRPALNASGGDEGGGKRRSWRTQMGTAATLLLHPALILVDNGHFQYNSVMLALTLGAVTCFNVGNDLLGATLFVFSMAYKQMALYYAPAIFAYLFGKCLYLPGPQGLALFIHLAIVSSSTLVACFLPFFIYPSFPDGIQQAIHRIFPFARGLFEDKVANAWCALNVVVKLREVASVNALARLALLVTGTALLPGMLAILWTSWRLGKATVAEESKVVAPPPPATVRLLPHSLFVSSMAFFLFSFQVHEKSILLPLMPLGLMMAGKEPGMRGRDWEWGVLVGNIAVFSMWPLLKRDGLALQYFALTLFYNYAIGYNPLALTRSFVKYLSIVVYILVALLHLVEATASPPAHLQDLFVVLNLTLCCGVFGLAWLWGLKRQLQEGWALGGLGFGNPTMTSGTTGGTAKKGPGSSVGRTSAAGWNGHGDVRPHEMVDGASTSRQQVSTKAPARSDGDHHLPSSTSERPPNSLDPQQANRITSVRGSAGQNSVDPGSARWDEKEEERRRRRRERERERERVDPGR